MNSRYSSSRDYFRKRSLKRQDLFLEDQEAKYKDKMYSGIFGAALLAFMSTGQREDHQLFTLGYAAVVFGSITLYNAGKIFKTHLSRSKLKRELELNL